MDRYVIVTVTNREGKILGSFKAELQDCDTEPAVFTEIQDLVEFAFEIEEVPIPRP